MALINGQPGVIDAETRAVVDHLHETGNHYRAAIVEGTGDALLATVNVSLAENPEWWIARAAARYAATRFLREALDAGVTPEQYERLLVVANDVAED